MFYWLFLQFQGLVGHSCTRNTYIHLHYTRSRIRQQDNWNIYINSTETTLSEYTTFKFYIKKTVVK